MYLFVAFLVMFFCVLFTTGAIKNAAFQAQSTLERIDIRNNLVSSIEAGAFANLEHLKFLLLSRNRLTRFNSDVFQGADNLQQLDLAENFISEFPTVALRAFTNLRYLNLSSNLMQVIRKRCGVHSNSYFANVLDPGQQRLVVVSQLVPFGSEPK